MSQENVEMVRGLLEPFKGVDYTAIDWDDEAELVKRAIAALNERDIDSYRLLHRGH